MTRVNSADFTISSYSGLFGISKKLFISDEIQLTKTQK
jgi:hypothetical protein